ncbi:DNA replication/repair protein RecF [Clostridium septicum]|uniref:DNA replication and repair protein RecF n=1 Tax=Clostridium septicum TaxID=1504 RepID=A0A9N7PJ40_CLOSE|nr:DNA replication/repair protein RecF [Clostridium septicum]AYE34331.1 DNA replication and repair protein RecF [Clostridium septicum]MDU1314290.1 DNA replication/repair protein RecF [Clostridium septicum]QAS59727.1 DNA replication/repair protein RecF [Clostridium septicum]UEC21031.1 DNA replication/repair protein RecF [Clostridium septicum]USS00920.1 DNA replication/repair protein RecF [Clostridium septicum]
MYIKKLQLLNYRNYKVLDIDLGKYVNVFMGDNAQGKTNILEAMYYCAFAKSHRTSRDRELLNWESENAYVSLTIGKDRLDKKIDITILKDGKKAIRINKVKVNKIGELFGTFNVVMFSPEDLKIIKDSPGVRRKFIDMELCQLDSRYYYNLVQYNKVLNERNMVLKNRRLDEEILDIYDIQLSNYGHNIIIDRLKYIDKLNFYGKNIHKDISSGKEEVEFRYISLIKDLDNIENNFYELLKKNRKKDMERGITSVGPHRDDFSTLINGVDTKSYGSQGQQRSAVLTIKFSSLKIIKELTSEYPVLLLDDVLSELDFSRKRYILKTIGEIQTVITCTGIEDLTDYLDQNSKVFKVKNGEILN